MGPLKDGEYQLIRNTLYIDLAKDNIIFIDETRVNIKWNVRIFYPKGKKNLRKVSSQKNQLKLYRSLAPRGKSHISFPEKTNATIIVVFLLKLLRKNTHNTELMRK